MNLLVKHNEQIKKEEADKVLLKSRKEVNINVMAQAILLKKVATKIRCWVISQQRVKRYEDRY
jgi:hypothetical protein